jgi:hypothetical protein
LRCYLLTIVYAVKLGFYCGLEGRPAVPDVPATAATIAAPALPACCSPLQRWCAWNEAEPELTYRACTLSCDLSTCRALQCAGWHVQAQAGGAGPPPGCRQRRGVGRQRAADVRCCGGQWAPRAALARARASLWPQLQRSEIGQPVHVQAEVTALALVGMCQLSN